MTRQDGLLSEQIAYYSARAAEYDRRLSASGTYISEGGGARADLQPVLQAIHSAAGGRVLELACGTGGFTQHLARVAGSVLAVDASAEMLEINRSRVPASNVELRQADIFSWTPDEQFDLVFFGFWLTHVPREKFEAFWALVRSALKPAGQFVLVDEHEYPAVQAHEERLGGGEVIRTLEDGRRFRAVKVFYKPDWLEGRLAELGLRSRFLDVRPGVFWGSGQLVNDSA